MTHTSEDIIEGMAGIFYKYMADDCYTSHDAVVKFITYLTSIGYQITKIEPDEDAINSASFEDSRADIYKTISAECRITVEGE